VALFLEVQIVDQVLDPAAMAAAAQLRAGQQVIRHTSTPDAARAAFARIAGTDHLDML
jgi:hypothetical protein